MVQVISFVSGCSDSQPDLWELLAYDLRHKVGARGMNCSTYPMENFFSALAMVWRRIFSAFALMVLAWIKEMPYGFDGKEVIGEKDEVDEVEEGLDRPELPESDSEDTLDLWLSDRENVDEPLLEDAL
jgi:hypothetical protein